MITLESKMKKVEQYLSDQTMIAAAIAPFSSLIDKSEDETKELLLNCEIYQRMFQKFFTASVVSMVCDKAAQLETRGV